MISRVLRIVVSQNRFKYLYDELFNIDKFSDENFGLKEKCLYP